MAIGKNTLFQTTKGELGVAISLNFEFLRQPKTFLSPLFYQGQLVNETNFQQKLSLLNLLTLLKIVCFNLNVFTLFIYIIFIIVVGVMS